MKNTIASSPHTKLGLPKWRVVLNISAILNPTLETSNVRRMESCILQAVRYFTVIGRDEKIREAYLNVRCWSLTP
ncbi:hypothetical protein TNCV_3873091 [Trichonephila clavipes]|nr:hypothetical protein TNCV_3873091 [Trichonephila clavipes]